MRYMLDTNTCIYIINRRPEHVLKRFTEFEPGDIAISSITLYELFYGAYKSKRVEGNCEAIRQFTTPLEVFAFDDGAADICGQIRARLEKNGAIIGAMDMQIAAVAMVNHLVLVTNNTNEFQRIEGLKLENWI